MENKEKAVIDLNKIFQILWKKKMLFFKVWPIVFILSCLWIFPQPRYYKCEVALAPESAGEDISGSIGSLASSFGLSLGTSSNDAIYPLLYPDLLESNDFIIGILGVRVKTLDGTVDTDYYTYIKKHQKTNWLTQPFTDMSNAVKKMFASNDTTKRANKANELNPFQLSLKDYELVEGIKSRIQCSIDKKTDVVSITVQDQDPLVSAVLADSIKEHLQTFITDYRTQKARNDANHYKELTDSAQVDYNRAVAKYSAYCDANQNIILQANISERDNLEEDMQLKFNTYSAMKTQYEAMKAKVLERTPVFTTLKSATVPVKPAGPKRVIFVAAMMILSTILTCTYLIIRNKKAAQ